MSENSKRQIAVVWETSYSDADRLSILVGTCTSLREAVGAAYLQLTDDIRSKGDDQQYTITPIYELEADTGYGMELSCSADTTYKSRVLILIAE